MTEPSGSGGQTGAAYPEPRRLSFPDDERTHPWLSLLLEGYYLVDQGVSEGVRRQERQGRELACARGCSACCRSHRTIPVYPLELVGLSWYVTERITGGVREALKGRLGAHKDGDPCPFLVDGICAVHPLRPMACRQFNVFGRVCEEGEDAYYTRRGDVLSPIQSYVQEAFYAMLPFYGIKQKGERRRMAKSGALHRLASVMQGHNWSSLAEKMQAFDARLARGVI